MAARVPFALAVVLTFIALFGVSRSQTSNVLRPNRPPNSGVILSQGNFRFELVEETCQLVLFQGRNNIIWQTAPRQRQGCTVTLRDDGPLVLQDGEGNYLDTIPPYGTAAKDSVVVLRPDGKVGFYTNKVWSRRGAESPLGAMLPRVRNILFSGQILSDNERLRAGEFTFTMKDDCNLVLSSGWESNTAGRGKHCFVRLNHSGRLEIHNDSFEEIWNNGVNSNDGEYVAVLFDNGEIAVFGPQYYAIPERRVSAEDI